MMETIRLHEDPSSLSEIGIMVPFIRLDKELDLFETVSTVTGKKSPTHLYSLNVP